MMEFQQFNAIWDKKVRLSELKLFLCDEQDPTESVIIVGAEHALIYMLMLRVR